MAVKDQYPDLDIEILRGFAKGWGEKFSCIESVILCKAGTDFSSTPGSKGDVKYVLVITVPPNPKSKFRNNDGSTSYSFEYKDLTMKIDCKASGVTAFDMKVPPSLKLFKERISKEYERLKSDPKAMGSIINTFVAEAEIKYPELEILMDYHEWAQVGPCDQCDYMVMAIPSFYTSKYSSWYSAEQEDHWKREDHWKQEGHWFWYDIAPGEDTLSLNEDVNDYILYGSNQTLYLRPEKKLTPSQEDRLICQGIAKRVWLKYPILDIKHMIKYPDILNIWKNCYDERTIHKWIKEVAPDRATAPGKRSLKVRSEQQLACQKLNIPL